MRRFRVYSRATERMAFGPWFPDTCECGFAKGQHFLFPWYNKGGECPGTRDTSLGSGGASSYKRAPYKCWICGRTSKHKHRMTEEDMWEKIIEDGAARGDPEMLDLVKRYSSTAKLEAFGKLPEASSKCWICGKDTPHEHDEATVRNARKEKVQS